MTIAFLVPPFSTHPTFSRTVAVTRPSVQRVSRRHVLRVVAGVVLVAPFVTQGEEIDPRKYVNGQVSLDQFRVLLENGDIDRVWFYGAFNEYCVFRLKKDAAIKYIGQGYPTEDARSNQSPLQVMAKVPYIHGVCLLVLPIYYPCFFALLFQSRTLPKASNRDHIKPNL